jgi:hypothetical protein
MNEGRGAVVGAVLLCAACSAEEAREETTQLTATMTIFGTSGVPSGTLGGVPFGGSSGDVNLTFSFTGDQSDVVSYFIPADSTSIGDGEGYEIVAGTATLQIEDAQSGSVIARGTFSPDAGVFVSVDNGNGGLGFGSRGSLPGGPTWPNKGMEVAYPYALFREPTDVELISNFSTAEPLPAAACPGFNKSPGPVDPNGSGCNAGFNLGTSAGDFYLDVDGLSDPRATGVFTVELH